MLRATAAIYSNLLHNFYRRCPYIINYFRIHWITQHFSIYDLELSEFAIISAELEHVAISKQIRCELDDIFDMM